MSDWEFHQLDNENGHFDREIHGMFADRYRGRPNRIDRLKRREIQNEC